MTEPIDDTPPKVNRSEAPKHIRPLLLVLFTLAFLLIKALSPALRPARASDLTVENILSAVNKERGLRDLILLNANSMLSFAGRSKADDMQARHYFAHVDPDGNYIWPKIVAAGYTPYLQLGENLAIEFDSTDSLMAAWMNSPTHRANILNDGFKDQGMGLAFGDASLGQYHSAVANTFGTLIVKKAAAAEPTAATPAPTAPIPAPKPLPKPAPKPLPKPEPTPAPPATSSPTHPTSPKVKAGAPTPPAAVHATPAPTPEQAQLALTPRGYAMTNGAPGQTQASQKTLEPPVPATTASAPAVINAAEGAPAASPNYSRYFTLAFGALFLLFLLTDLRGMAANNLAHLDKKINNIVLLILALVVVAVMYWL
jgi:uncharacterized protein YkwD